MRSSFLWLFLALLTNLRVLILKFVSNSKNKHTNQLLIVKFAQIHHSHISAFMHRCRLSLWIFFLFDRRNNCAKIDICTMKCSRQPLNKPTRRTSAWARTERLKARKGHKTNPIWKGNTASWSHDRQTDQEGGNPLVHRKTHPQLRLEGGRNRCPITRQSRKSIALPEIFEKKLGNQGGSGLEKTSLTATTPSTEDCPLGLIDCQRRLSICAGDP